jgi:hypothetical protein
MQAASPNIMTEILPSYPGYVWKKHDGNVSLDWAPIPSIYSPPVLHQDLVKGFVPVHVPVPMGIIIGHQGHHFKTITHKSGCLYIYYNQDYIEIWGTQDAVNRATHELLQHLFSIYQKWKEHSTEAKSDHIQFWK